MENMHHMPMPSVSPASAQAPFPTSVMPAHINAPMQVSPEYYDNANVPYMHTAPAPYYAPHCSSFSNMGIILVLFILLVIIIRCRFTGLVNKV
jgi:hypothetical protein